jgi:hypothetical protein
MPVARSAKVAGSGTVDAVAVPEMSKAWTPSIDCQWFAAQRTSSEKSDIYASAIVLLRVTPVLRGAAAARPRMPVARSAKVAGSGTIDAVAMPEMSKAS